MQIRKRYFHEIGDSTAVVCNTYFLKDTEGWASCIVTQYFMIFVCFIQQPYSRCFIDLAAPQSKLDSFCDTFAEGKSSVAGEGHCHVFPKSGHKKDSVTGEWTKSCTCGLTLPFEKMQAEESSSALDCIDVVK